MKLGIILGDEHLDATEVEHPSYSLVKKFIKSQKPDFIVKLGDWLDMNYLSSFDRDNLKHLEGRRLVSDFDLGKRDLDFLQRNSKEVILLQGNHDERVDRLVSADPRWEGFVEYPKVFDLKERGIKYFPLLKQPFRRGKLNFIHGYWAGLYPARKHLDVYLGNVVMGHVHRFQTFSRVVPNFDTEVQCWTLGCLSDVQPDYLKGQPMGWQHGFAIVYLKNDGSFQLYPINIIKNSFVWERRIWK
jgi:predicted phosphodiesterase